MQIYENLFRQDAGQRYERGDLRFDKKGEVIPSKSNGLDNMPVISDSLRPLLEFIDGYRRRVSAPENTLIRKKYTRYADLSFI